MKMTQADFEAHQRKHGFANPPKPAQMPLIAAPAGRLDFFMEFCPPTVTAQHKGASIITPKAGKPFIHWYTKKEIEDAEKALAAQLAPHRPAAPFQGPLRLVADWIFPWRASEAKKNRSAGWMFNDRSPDADNLMKAILDVMQKEGFYLNDSQIADLRCVKMWGDRPGIRITIEELKQP